MNLVRMLLAAATLFFCLWSALLARFKGYSALCWLLACGPLGVLLLWRLPLVSSSDPKKRRRGNQLGLAFSALLLLSAWLTQAILEN